MRPLLCALCLAFGCVAYDQDVLSVVEDLTPPADFSLPNSDGMPPKCSRQQNSAPQCRDPVEWVKTAAKTCCDLLGQQLTLAQFDRPCWGMVPFGYGLVQFECCPSSVPIPTTSCEPKKLGGECLEDGIWKSRAAVVCGQSGRALTGPRSSGSCGIGRSTGIAFDCCPIPCVPSS